MLTVNDTEGARAGETLCAYESKRQTKLGWDVPAGRSTIAEVYPSLWSRTFACEARNPDQHDAYCIAAWLSRADRDGSLVAYLRPDLTPRERAVAQVEGWILGVPV